MTKRSKPKTIVIGLDGATFDVMLPFVRKGKLPTLARLLKEGAWGELESTIPPVTAAAWPSFMTGENPGKHGILSFMQPQTKQKGVGQAQQVVTTKSFSGRTFFDVMSSKGMRVGVIAVPVTYPPWDINGIMISGYPCPDNDKIYSVSKDISINVSEPLNFGAEYYRVSTEEQIVEDCLHRDKLRAKLSFDLLRRYDFDCFVVVFGGIDRAQHDYWKYYDPEYPGVAREDRDKFRDAIFRNYQLADEEIGKILKLYGEDTNLFIISDHGAGRHPFSFFNSSLWLKNNNLLELKGCRASVRHVLRKIYHELRLLFTPKNAKSMSFFNKIKPGQVAGGTHSFFDWEKTKAFDYPLAYPAGGIMLNVKERQVKGIVNPGQEYDQLVSCIIQNLLEYRDEMTGDKVIENAFRRDEIYRGAYVDSFPDIVYILNPDYVNGKEIFGSVISPVSDFQLSKKSGLHRMNGIFVSHGPMIMPGQIEGASILDIAPTVLYCCGAPIPDNMDGVVLEKVFNEDVLKQHPVEYCKWEVIKRKKEAPLESKENEQMKKKLRSLGYI